MQKRLQKVHQIVSSPEYQGQDIHLEDEYPFEDDYEYTLEEESEEETNDTEPITVFLGTLTSTKCQRTQEISLNALDSHPDKIFAKVKINEVHDMSLKVDTGAVYTVQPALYIIQFIQYQVHLCGNLCCHCTWSAQHFISPSTIF